MILQKHFQLSNKKGLPHGESFSAQIAASAYITQTHAMTHDKIKDWYQRYILVAVYLLAQGKAILVEKNGRHAHQATPTDTSFLFQIILG